LGEGGGAEISVASVLRKIATEVKQSKLKAVKCEKEKYLEDFKIFYWGGGDGGWDYRAIRTLSSPSYHSVCAV
jgi:hypothetical protein